MLAKVWSAALVGIEAVPLEVQVDVSPGMPMFQIVGLPDAAVRESRERVRAALRNMGKVLPPRNVVVNLAPADLRKEGSALDLPLAIGLLAALGEVPMESLEARLLVGELSLDGALRPIAGALPMAALVAREGFRELLLPQPNAAEAAAVDGAATVGLVDLWAALGHLKGESPIDPHAAAGPARTSVAAKDLRDVAGQRLAKRALEIAAAGGHNLLMVGPPGTGKTMLAERLPSILPSLSSDEALETTAIHSVAGLLSPGEGLLHQRPFRAPHHSASGAGLVGGGNPPRPGEISLAHNGVLFLDELPEFRRDVLELLRQPLEEGAVTIVRSGRRVRFPARFVLVAAMNPCPCGDLGNPRKACRCTPREIARYVSRISGPLLDRVDLQVEVSALPWRELAGEDGVEPSAVVRERVEGACRYRVDAGRRPSNSGLTTRELRRWYDHDGEGGKLLESAVARLGLSARGAVRVLRVARTIADLDASERMTTAHLAEALQYRGLDRRASG